MENLNPEQQVLATQQGEVLALKTCIHALLISMPEQQREVFAKTFSFLEEWTRAQHLSVSVPEQCLQSFDQEVAAMRATFEQQKT